MHADGFTLQTYTVCYISMCDLVAWFFCKFSCSFKEVIRPPNLPRFWIFKSSLLNLASNSNVTSWTCTLFIHKSKLIHKLVWRCITWCTIFLIHLTYQKGMRASSIQENASCKWTRPILTLKSASRNNWWTVGGNGGCRGRRGTSRRYFPHARP